MYDLLPLLWPRSGAPILRFTIYKWCPNAKMYELFPLLWPRSGAPMLRCTTCCRCCGLEVTVLRCTICCRCFGLAVVPHGTRYAFADRPYANCLSGQSPTPSSQQCNELYAPGVPHLWSGIHFSTGSPRAHAKTHQMQVLQAPAAPMTLPLPAPLPSADRHCTETHTPSQLTSTPEVPFVADEHSTFVWAAWQGGHLPMSPLPQTV